MKYLRTIKPAKLMALILFSALLLMGFSGCAAFLPPTLLVEYDSDVANRSAIRAKANITVTVNVGEKNQYKYFKRPETKKSIIDAITKDLQQNIFYFGEEELDVLVSARLTYREQPWYLLTWIIDPLWLLGLPLAKAFGEAHVSLEIHTLEGVFVGSYQSRQIISKWYNLYTAPKVQPNTRSKGGISKDVLKLALEDIKNQILEDRATIAQAIRKKQPSPKPEPVVEKREPAKPSPPADIPSSDVDRSIPISSNPNPDALAVVLGIEKYRHIPDVTYARRDAATFREYAARVLGVKDDVYHLYYRVDDEATKAEFEKLFAADGWIARRAQPTTDVYIYYAGHGAPNVRERSAYLIPHDGDINYPVQTGFSLSRLYEELGKLDVRSVTVFLDACFSGVSRENEVLLADARPIFIELQGPTTQGDITVYSAATGTQVSSAWPEQGHGLFTYYLLKGLKGEADQNWDEQITLDELGNYLTENVIRRAGLLDREQTPLMMTRDESRILVQYR